jgi:malate dehydrogenase (oxaloacetate-decarboxylating)(NADP+)
MKKAAAYALANLAKEPVPDDMKLGYNQPDLAYGKDYVIPKALSKEVVVWVASAVAQAAFDEGIAKVDSFDIDEYKKELRQMLIN